MLMHFLLIGWLCAPGQVSIQGKLRRRNPVPHTQETLEKMAEEILELSKVAAVARSRASGGHADVTESEFLALDLLARQQPMTIGDIQKAIGVVPAQMSRIIRALEGRDGGGYIQCSINAQDRRRIDVVLTDRGREVHQSYRASRLSSILETLSTLTIEDRIQFMRILGKIRQRFAQRPGNE
jgi:DNA-binding MarR family transcriptional regulator